MNPCDLGDKFKQLGLLGGTEVLSLYKDYNDQVRLNPACANVDQFKGFHEALERTQQETMAKDALGMAFLNSLQMRAYNPGSIRVFREMWLQGTPDKKDTLAQIQVNQSAARQPYTEKGWRDVACISNRENCRSEAEAARGPLYQHMKRYLNQALYAHIRTGQRAQITAWLTSPLSLTAWQEDPRIILDILDHYIETNKFVFKNEDRNSTANMVIVLRELLEATSKKKGNEFVQISPETLKKYTGAEGLPVYGVELAVGAYLRFLSYLSDTALPDMALMKELSRLADLKVRAQEIEVRVKARIQESSGTGGKK